MYSRSQDRSERPIRIPEHYSGCAFSPQKQPQKTETAVPKQPPSHPKPAKPSPPLKTPHDLPKEQQHAPPPSLLLPPPPVPQPQSILPPKPPQALFGNLGSAFPFSHGLGSDELLIIGLILLLARNGQDSDMILWLALLLFCG